MNNDSDFKTATRLLSKMSQLALTAVTCIAISLLIGYGLDRLFNTQPIFFVIFAILSPFAAIKTMVDLAKKF